MNLFVIYFQLILEYILFIDIKIGELPSCKIERIARETIDDVDKVIY